MKYRCRICGCYLDPGEGDICEDCKEEEKGPQRCHQHLQGPEVGIATKPRTKVIVAFPG